MEKAECLVADATGQIKITLWANQVHQVEIGKCYKITKASVRIFETKNLSTTKDTVISIIEDIGQVQCTDTELKPDEIVSKNLEIESASCQKVNTCNICKRSIGDVNEQVEYIKCGNCNMRQPTSKIIKSFKTEVTTTDNNQSKRYVIVESARKDNVILSTILNTQDLETYLLKNPTVQVQVDHSDTYIKKITFLN